MSRCQRSTIDNIEQERRVSICMFQGLHRLLRRVLKSSMGYFDVCSEWPRYSVGWKLDMMQGLR
eukprot:12828698-Heterocapsa_arctica.AAC.1